MKIKLIATRHLLMFSFMWVFPAWAQFNPERVTKELQQAYIKDSLPGLVVVLVNKKKILYKNTFGHADITAGKPYSLETTQEVGSVSKMILAVALMKAVELNYFTLDTEINQILPFKVINPLELSHSITIRELATHTSGIVDDPKIYMNTYRFHLQMRPYNENFWAPMKTVGFKRELPDSTISQFCFNYLAQKGNYYSDDNFVYSKSGRTSVYSNIATTLLAYLIEIKSGLSYKTFTYNYIFKPLKMDHSAWFTSELKLSNLAQLYLNKDTNIPLYDLVTYPDGGLKTNGVDLSKFLIDVMNGLSGKSKILKPASFQIMFSPQFSNENKPARINLNKRNKGILWNLYTNGTIGHDGDDPGISAFIAFNPSSGLGGLFISNKYLEDKSLISDIITKTISK